MIEYDEELYHKWLVGKDNNPFTAPSAHIGYVNYLERKVRKLERRAATMTQQRDNLLNKLRRQKELRRIGA